MLKAYAVAVALSTTSPVNVSNDVEAKPLDSQSEQTQVQKGFKRRGGLIVIPAENVQVQKGFKRRGGLIVIP